MAGADRFELPTLNNMSQSEFLDTTSKKTLNKQQRELLKQKISDLSLKIKGTRLESSVTQLYKELKNNGISFKPKTYLSDQWGCPQGEPVIGIPFYLADPQLSKLEGQITGIKAENKAEVMMCLRHEAGHAFNYAYRLYNRLDWRRRFGRFSREYRYDYKPVPFSAKYVRHLRSWYVQKHPDDDFAESFAVWLTPGSDWRIHYADTPALAKLLYVDKIADKFGHKSPVVTSRELDMPVRELTMTLAEWYEIDNEKGGVKDCTDTSSHPAVNLHPTIDNDLRRLFPAKQGKQAADILDANRIKLVWEVNYWTGVNWELLDNLFDELLERIKFLDLKIEPEQTAITMVSVAVFITTLAMNYLDQGKFIDA